MKSTIFSSCLILEPTSDVFSMARPRFFPFYRLFPLPFSHFESKLRRFCDVTSLFSAPNFNFSLLFPVLPHASGTFSRDLTHYFPRTPFLHSVKAFSIRASLTLHALLHLYLPISAPHSPRPSPPSPTFFLFPPHFSISLPNKRTIARTLAQYARTSTSAHTLARQEVFVFFLHRFTHLPQSAVHQHIRCEGKQEKAFTKYTTISKSTSYHKFPISSTMNSIYQRGEPHLTTP